MHGTDRRQFLTGGAAAALAASQANAENVVKFRRIDNYHVSELDLIEDLACREARDSFWAYRQMMTPSLILGWWQREVAAALQRFYIDWLLGRRPVLILEAPPQHGKTTQVSDFCAWASGQNPDLKTIYASYSDALGTGVNMYLQRTFDSPRYQRIFPETCISRTNTVTVTSRFARNSGMIEFVDRRGSFRNTTVLGQITGFGLHLGLIDDPMKGREAASSETIRNKTWMWFTDDFFTRFADDAALLMIMTRWHLDDPVGRFLERYPNATVLRYPALAEQDEAYRVKGMPLFPEHKSLEFLLQRKALMTIGSWESLYQQNPIVVGGDMFPVSKIDIKTEMPAPKNIRRSVRYWDKAGSHGEGAFSAGVLMHQMTDKTFLVEHVARGQWASEEREKRIRQTAVMDNRDRLVETFVEQEPGSGGKESAENTVRNLAGYSIKPDRVTGKKEFRAEPYAAQVQAGNVAVLSDRNIVAWNRDYLDELEQFPNGKYKDQVDASSGAFAKLTLRESNYDVSMSWVGNLSQLNG